MVTNERSILKNAAFATFGRGSGDFFMFLLLVALARAYGKDVLGEYALAMALGTVLRVLIIQGVNTLLVREIAKNPNEAPRLVGAMAVAQLAVAVFLYSVFLAVVVGVVGDADAHRITILIVTYHLLYTLALIFKAYFRAREASQYGALLEGGHKAMILILAVAAIVLSWPAEHALLALPLGGVTMYLAGYYLMRSKGVAPRYHVDVNLALKFVLLSMPLFASTILSIVQPRFGIFVLGATQDKAAMGIYATGDKLIAAADLIIMMFVGAVLPVMSRIAHLREQLEQLYVRALRLIVTFSLPVGMFIFLLRAELIELLFGVDFSGGATVLGILALSMVFGGINALSLTMHIARNKLKHMLYIQIAVVAVFLVCVLLLVGRFGYIGLAWSVFASKLSGCLIHLIYLARTKVELNLRTTLTGPLAASVGVFASFGFMSQQPLAAQISVALVVGLVLLVAFKGVSMRDIDYLRRIFGGAD